MIHLKKEHGMRVFAKVSLSYLILGLWRSAVFSMQSSIDHFHHWCDNLVTHMRGEIGRQIYIFAAVMVFTDFSLVNYKHSLAVYHHLIVY